MTSAITATNKTHQNIVNKAYKALRAYHELVNLDGTFSTDKQEEANQRKQEINFNKYLESFESLPVKEQKNFNKQHKEIHGYC